MTEDFNSNELKSNLRSRAFAALASTSMIVALDRAFQIVPMVIVARLVGPEQTAIAMAVGLVVGMAVLLSTWGIGAALIQALPMSRKTDAVARSIILGLSIIGLALIELGAPLAGQWFRNPHVVDGLRVAGVACLFQPLTAVASAHLVRTMRAQYVATADLLSSALSTFAVIIPLALLGWEFWSLIYGLLAQAVLRATLLCIFARQPIRLGRDLGLAGTLMKRGGGFMLNAILNRGNQDAPRWIVGRFLPTADLGLLSRASSLAAYPASLFSAMVERVAFPAIGLLQHDRKRLKAALLEALQLTAVVGVPLTIALLILSPFVIRVVLGPDWVEAAGPFRILSLAIYMRIGDRLTWTILRGTGRPFLLGGLQVISIILIVLACAVGVNFGLEGVCIAVTGVMISTYLVGAAVSMKVVGIGIGEWLVAHRPALITGLLAGAVLAPLSLGLQEAGRSAIEILAAAALASALVAAGAITLAPKLFLGDSGARLLRSITQFALRERSVTQNGSVRKTGEGQD